MKTPLLLSTVLAFSICASSCNKNITSVEKTATAAPAKHGIGSMSKITGATVLAAPVAEAKIYKLLKGYDSNDDFEASGVYYLDGYFYVVCDNRYKIAKIKSTLPENSSDNSLLSSGSGSSNFEGITYDDN